MALGADDTLSRLHPVLHVYNGEYAPAIAEKFRIE